MTSTELYRDPVYDGATDPVVVIADGLWWMFYTQRRATHPNPGPGVAWVHGSRVGVAQSPDGVAWAYIGTLEPDAAGLALRDGPPPAAVDATHWAPEVIHDGRRWRMYLTEIDGIPDRWPGFARTIVEYASEDLRRWERRGPIELGSDRVIDAAVARCADGLWRLWFKDEAADSVTKVAASADLNDWHLEGTAIGGRAHEGPCAFELGGSWWMIVDEWRGMGVYRSDDAVVWERQGGPDAVILGAGEVPGPGFGHHVAAMRDGDDVWFYYFGHPQRTAPPPSDQDTVDDRRCAVYRARLSVVDGELRCDA
jgi:hypothetical protein